MLLFFYLLFDAPFALIRRCVALDFSALYRRRRQTVFCARLPVCHSGNARWYVNVLDRKVNGVRAYVCFGRQAMLECDVPCRNVLFPFCQSTMSTSRAATSAPPPLQPLSWSYLTARDARARRSIPRWTISWRRGVYNKHYILTYTILLTLYTY